MGVTGQQLLWVLDKTLDLAIRIQARTRKDPPTRRGNLANKPEIKEELLRHQNGRCAYCNQKISAQLGNFDVDHKTPLARQGRDSKQNLQALCSRCNREKGTRTHREYLHFRQYGRDLQSYQDFKSKPKFLSPHESFVRSSLAIILGALIIGVLLGELLVSGTGVFVGGVLGTLSVVWAVSAYTRGLRTGALSRSARRNGEVE